jgi:formamidopyrimidine-DNA glycosylase
MPEVLEAESFAAAARRVLGRRVESVWVASGYERPSSWAVTHLAGGVVRTVDRVGKVVLLGLAGEESAPAPVHVYSGDLSPPPAIDFTLALRFGMTGRLIIDGQLAIGDLEYGPSSYRPEWIRFRVGFGRPAPGSLEMLDPRRLGSVQAFVGSPELGLGPDVVRLTAEGTAGDSAESAQWRRFRSSNAALKSRLLDQQVLAGIGNLLADDALWRAGISPHRRTSSLSDREASQLFSSLRATLGELRTRGGSHTGDLQPFRRDGGPCPRCGEPLRSDRIGGRTTLWCPAHQG